MNSGSRWGLPAIVFLASSCASTPPLDRYTITSYDSLGRMQSRIEIAHPSSLGRLFPDGTANAAWIEGEGRYSAQGEGLARRAAIALALSDLARKIRASTVTVEGFAALSGGGREGVVTISNYTVLAEDYDVATGMYSARVGVQVPQAR